MQKKNVLLTAIYFIRRVLILVSFTLKLDCVDVVFQDFDLIPKSWAKKKNYKSVALKVSI